ncbi:MAG: hypothetical protein P8M80_08625 [Pirellulaceae bacterium]|nr:hypothetical protein [Pirellulaceae bacterium]
MSSTNSLRSESLTTSSDNPISLSNGSTLGWKRGLVVVLLCGFASLVPIYYWNEAEAPKSYLTHIIEKENLVVSVTEQGTLESSNNTEVKCKVRGFNTVTWVVEVGTEVNEGDELVRLDTKIIEESVSLQKTNRDSARAELERTKADVAKSQITRDAYEAKEGRYDTQWQALNNSKTLAEKRLATATKVLDRTEKLYSRGYINKFELEQDRFQATQRRLELQVIVKQIEVLENYTKKMRMATLNGNLLANKSKKQADEAGLEMDTIRLERAKEELLNCVIRAPRSGLVIYPSSAEWKETPDITEGATVRKDQILLLMPDLKKMQVKVGIHESVVHRISSGSEAVVRLTEQEVYAEVSSVATVTKPAGWWTGNVVKYDTIIELPDGKGLKPGMSADVEIIIARYSNVITIPVAAVLQTEEGNFCWVLTAGKPKRRLIELGDSNELFIVVNAGLQEGEEVILNPLAHIDDAPSTV